MYDQKKQSLTNGSVKLEIGDYINYNCHLENEEIYESKAEMNGYANQKFSSNSYSGAWRVFGADSSGNLLIISESAISPDEGGYTNEIYNTIGFGMHGNLAYINAITEINNVCAIYGKGDKERRVYFDAKAKVHLMEYIESRKDKNPALFVTLDAPYDRLKISGVEIRLRQLGRELGLERIHPHKFRRTMATRAIDKGMPIEQVQKILGHSQIDTTMQYAMVNQNNVKASHQKYMS
mgnify:CR=1 FL=1